MEGQFLQSLDPWAVDLMEITKGLGFLEEKGGRSILVSVQRKTRAL